MLNVNSSSICVVSDWKKCFVVDFYRQFKSDCLSKRNLTGSKGNVLFPLRLLLQWVLCTEFIVLEKKLTAHCLLCPLHSLMSGMLLMMQHFGRNFARRCSLVCLCASVFQTHLHVFITQARKTQVCNGFRDLLGGFQQFVFGSGAIDWVAKRTNDLMRLGVWSWEGWRSLCPASSGLMLCSVLS